MALSKGCSASKEAPAWTLCALSTLLERLACLALEWPVVHPKMQRRPLRLAYVDQALECPRRLQWRIRLLLIVDLPRLSIFAHEAVNVAVLVQAEDMEM